ncbi:MAG: hypothetical protein R3250_03680 [Melioribacteraceae bacterium]|nr:hypothetical protein [Melioribacteraceae bacterium]
MIGEIVGHYRILEKLGSGGMGINYRALDIKHDRYVGFNFLLTPFLMDEDLKRWIVNDVKITTPLIILMLVRYKK